MKSLIKSSFVLILLMAVFNIGVSNAYAEETKVIETNRIENIDATHLITKSNTKTTCANLLITSPYFQEPCNIDVTYKEVNSDGSWSQLDVNITFPCDSGVVGIIDTIKNIFF